MKKKKFCSRISILMLLLLAVPILFIVLLADDYFPMLVMSSMILFIVLALVSVRYAIDGQTLHVKCCGFTSCKIDLQDICLVKRSYNPVSSPAASLKRLAVYQHGKFSVQPFLRVIISPSREKEFLETLKSCNPDIEIQVSEKAGFWRFWDWDI